MFFLVIVEITNINQVFESISCAKHINLASRIGCNNICAVVGIFFSSVISTNSRIIVKVLLSLLSKLVKILPFFFLLKFLIKNLISFNRQEA